MAEARAALGRSGGKVILLGEHAVVHGAKALVVGVPDRTEVGAREAPGPLRLDVPAWEFRVRANGDGQGAEALRALAAALGRPAEGVALEGTSKLIPRAGLGASASIAAAAARALAALDGRPLGDGALFDAVQAFERVFHGNPSGVDAAAVIAPGLLRFRRGEGAARLAFPAPELVILDTGEPGDTGVTVAAFARRLASGEGRARLAAIEGIVDAGERALEAGDLVALGRLMDEDHAHLSWFGVSTPALDRACAAARAAGALGAKLTGGGGGGCAIALAGWGSGRELAERLAAAGLAVVPS